VVVLSDPKYADNHRDAILNPVLVVEALSPSTEAYDRGFKSAPIPHHGVPLGVLPGILDEPN
jgi:hypothetical protein